MPYIWVQMCDGWMKSMVWGEINNAVVGYYSRPAINGGFNLCSMYMAIEFNDTGMLSACEEIP